ncbi:MAG: C25 family cysteine peptidase, partial [Candidatus Zixiibacteriota bacterium]
ALPPQITIDTVTAVETPSGDDPSPTSADGLAGVDKISDGFGFIHILAHGRKDGFIVKSANYADWPASLILSVPQDNSDHGSLLNLENNQMTSLYYSLTCDGGAYDLDSTDGASASWSLVEELISQPASGAIGMIANARWGWVYSSYLLQEKFTEYLYGPAEGSPALAMYNSWLDYPSFRDLIFGQNYFGDPTLRIYRGIPARTEISLEAVGDNTALYVTAGGGPLTGAEIVVSADDEILEYGTSDENGEYAIDMTMDNNVVYTITATHSGCTLARESYTPSISLDIDDTENILPDSYTLEQNYPNPFNPTTVIGWNLPQRSDVALQIYNILGQLVEKYDFSDQSSGYHSITWHGTDRDGNPVASGIYFYRLVAPEFQETKKMYLIK